MGFFSFFLSRMLSTVVKFFHAPTKFTRTVLPRCWKTECEYIYGLFSHSLFFILFFIFILFLKSFFSLLPVILSCISLYVYLSCIPFYVSIIYSISLYVYLYHVYVSCMSIMYIMYIPLCISISCISFYVYLSSISLYEYLSYISDIPLLSHPYKYPYNYLPFLNRTSCPVCRQSFAHKLERRPVDKWREEGDKLIKIRRRSWLVFKRTNSAQIDKRNEWLASKKIKRREKNKIKSKEVDKIMS